jgi:FtsP/CotA-like multicopper oxidase with cupredoxin domain
MFDNRFWEALAASAIILFGLSADAAGAWEEPPIFGASAQAVTLGRDLDDDGDPDEVTIKLEVIELAEEVYPGEFVTFWVFAPEGQGMTPTARTPSPTIRVEQGDLVRIILRNTHYFPHTIHLHGTIHPNAMDGVPDITQPAVKPGESFTYEFVAKNPGTHFYHCHVQPDVHVLMGLVGMLIIEPNRPGNLFSHVVPGAGRIEDLSKAVMERYQREYSLVYMDIDDRLNRIPALVGDPREIEKRMHREYESTQRQPNVFLLNGRSFPYTLRDTPIEVTSGERVKLRVLNAGARPIKLHTHGHHPTLTHLDGYSVPEEMRYTRDVFDVGAAQRIDLELHGRSEGAAARGHQPRSLFRPRILSRRGAGFRPRDLSYDAPGLRIRLGRGRAGGRATGLPGTGNHDEFGARAAFGHPSGRRKLVQDST